MSLWNIANIMPKQNDIETDNSNANIPDDITYEELVGMMDGDFKQVIKAACQIDDIEMVCLAMHDIALHDERPKIEVDELFGYACMSGNPFIAYMVIGMGVDVDWNHGLSCACDAQKKLMVKLMIERGASECYACNRTIEEHIQFAETYDDSPSDD
jgi:hypothetical protein